MPSSLGPALEVIGALEGLGVDYHLGGSVASTFHGIPRQTLDVDLVADLREQHVDAFVGRLEDRFYVDANAVRHAVAHRSRCNLVHLESGLKVDLFVLGAEPFDLEEFRRRIRGRLTEEPLPEVWFKSAEDTVLRKLLWYRAGGEVSDRQWRDVVGILKVQGDRLDADYLSVWARRLDLQDLLQRARGEA